MSEDPGTAQRRESWHATLRALPEPLQHPWGRLAADEDVDVYRGRLEVRYAGEGWQTADGGLRLSWSPRPRATWWAAPHEHDMRTLERWLAGTVEPVAVRPAPSGASCAVGAGPVPVPPHDDRLSHGLLNGSAEVGDGASLDLVDFFLVNGPDVELGGGLRDADATTFWRGRLAWDFDGWSVIADRGGPADVLSPLRKRGGYALTHACRLVRTGGASFAGNAAMDVLRGLEGALSFAAGRRVGTVLPVGSRNGEVVWSWLRTPAVHEWRTGFTWLDRHHGARQLAAVVPAWLGLWADPYEQLVLRYALGYHLGAGDPNPVETAITAGVSGLVLLSEARYVGGNRLTEDQWRGRKTPGQIRQLLTDCGIGYATNREYADLAAQGAAARAADVAKKQATKARQGKTYAPPSDPLDDVDGVLALRNLVAHPTGSRLPLPGEAWMQAWQTVSEWLDLALLARLGYTGDYFPRRDEQRWVGTVVPVPFATKVDALGP